MKSIDLNWIQAHVRPRLIDGHKKTFGHVLVIAGSEGKAGAAILCARAALHAGCGMVTAMVPKEAVEPLLAESPEIMYSTQSDLSLLDLTQFDAIAIGPGIGFSDLSIQNLIYLLGHYDKSIVIDADGLSILASHLELIKPNFILTPHPGELERLQGFDYDSRLREDQAVKFIEKHPCTLVLKGAHTIVASNANNVMTNTTGNDGMATAGTGDVLTGIIVSLCAQHYEPTIAACIGVYLHGLAGDLAIQNISKASLVASDLINYMGKTRLVD